MIDQLLAGWGAIFNVSIEGEQGQNEHLRRCKGSIGDVEAESAVGMKG
jgi:hypothetical protein